MIKRRRTIPGKSSWSGYEERLQADPEFRARIKPRVERQLIQAIFEGAIAHGQIDPTGKSAEQLFAELANLVLREDRRRKFLISTDHTLTLRDVAIEMRASGHPEISVVLLATWVEHVLNSLISAVVLRRGLSEETARQVIREVPLKGKLYWLLPLLGYPPIVKKRVTASNFKLSIEVGEANGDLRYWGTASPDSAVMTRSTASGTCQGLTQYRY